MRDFTNYVVSSRCGSEFESSFAHQIKLYANKNNNICSVKVYACSGKSLSRDTVKNISYLISKGASRAYIAKKLGCSEYEVECIKKDKFEGTDLTVNGIHVDFTTAFSTKDNMADTKFESISTKYGDIKFGIRLGNSYRGFTKFAKPVLVVGMDLENSFINTWCDAMMENFAKIMPTIVEAISKNYKSYCKEAGLAF